ncbi:BCL2 like 11 L homeolog isoform X8 [Xenopus laevis]|uniref:BCL2 like 11 L homeolog isoform X8 n=1 Tax=Xenopus laevis TaxID=8355 RepID=A0A8J0VE97_XENLA|nr:BCL2 like 11 L homeolog isoform X8 [Xenopus laevis]
MAKQPSVLSPECNSGEGGQLQSTSRRHSHRPRRRGAPTSLSSPFQAARNPVDQMTPELWIAQELRRIGDEFNASFTPRRGIFNHPPRPLENDQVIILRVLRFIIRLILRL